MPDGIRPGPWAAFRVTTRSKNLPPHEFTQRVAVVSEEGLGDQEGVWVELKTIDPEAGTRIERGFFVHGAAPQDSGGAGKSPPVRLLRRVQRLNSDGKLYEYPPDTDVGVRANEEVATLGLFEIPYFQAPHVDSLGHDTLRIGNRELLSSDVRKRWFGSDDWPNDKDTSHVWRAALTVTLHACPEVPITGYTRSTFEVASQSFPTSAPAGYVPPADSLKTGPVFYRTEVLLTDLGTGAVPEVTQEPEPAPEAEQPDTPSGPVR